MKLPDKIFGQDVEGALERYLKSSKNMQQTAPETVVPVSTNMSNIPDLSQYILLEGRQHGSYSYPDLLVAMHRLGYDANAEQAAKTLGLNLRNTAFERDGHQYIGNFIWSEALALNLLLGNFTLNPRQFVDFLQLLKSGNACDGLGAKLDNGRVNAVLDEILTKREPWRGEWLDIYFTTMGNKLYATYGHNSIVNGQLEPQHTEPLENCLMETGYVDLLSANRQGIPTRRSIEQEIYYLPPWTGKAAWFTAVYDRADLSFLVGPEIGGALQHLGVRPAREKK